MMDAAKAAAKAISALGDNKRATVYLSPKLVVSVCRRFRLSARLSRHDFVLKIGAPNVGQKDFVKKCMKAGEPFPVRKVQLQPWPVKRRA